MKKIILKFECGSIYVAFMKSVKMQSNSLISDALCYGLARSHGPFVIVCDCCSFFVKLGDMIADENGGACSCSAELLNITKRDRFMK